MSHLEKGGESFYLGAEKNKEQKEKGGKERKK